MSIRQRLTGALMAIALVLAYVFVLTKGQSL